MLTTAQIKWAMQHDWFLAYMGNGVILVIDRYVDADELHETSFEWKDTFQALIAWAGY